jgi:uncharacterized protein YrrD
MQNLRNVLGLPVLETVTGTQIGEVQEVVLDIERAVVIGIVVASANWFTHDQGIAFGDVFSIGRNAVMVRSRKVIRDTAACFPEYGSYHLRELFEKPIFTEAGVQLGILVDITFDDATGEIKEYQISDGLFTDLLYGRMMMPLPRAQVVGQDKLIVPELMTRLLHAETDLE